MSVHNYSWPLQDPFGGKGRLFLDDYHKRVWIYYNEEENRVEQCTEEYSGPTFEANQQELNDTAGERFGDLRRVARMPLAWYFRNIAPARAEGDVDYIKKKLNDSDFAKMRTFKGKI